MTASTSKTSTNALLERLVALTESNAARLDALESVQQPKAAAPAKTGSKTRRTSKSSTKAAPATPENGYTNRNGTTRFLVDVTGTGRLVSDESLTEVCEALDIDEPSTFGGLLDAVLENNRAGGPRISVQAVLNGRNLSRAESAKLRNRR